MRSNDGQKLKKNSNFKAILRRLFKNKGAVAGLVIVIILLLIVVFGDFLAPYDIKEINPVDRYLHPNASHWFGCDELGRDLFSRILVGTKYSLGLGICSIGSAVILGCALGSIVGYIGGRFDDVFMRVIDIIQAIPGMLLSIVICSVLGNGWIQTVIALAIGNVPGYVRLLRGSMLTNRKAEYIDAAVADNSSAFKIITKHLLPNSFAPVIVQSTMSMANTILTAASLSFIGLGILPPTPEWGALLSAGRAVIRDHPHLVIFPGVFIAITVLALNLLGDGLRDALDPKLKK